MSHSCRPTGWNAIGNDTFAFTPTAVQFAGVENFDQLLGSPAARQPCAMYCWDTQPSIGSAGACCEVSSGSLTSSEPHMNVSLTIGSTHVPSPLHTRPCGHSS